MNARRPAAQSSLSLLRDELHALFADVPATTSRGHAGVAVDVVDSPRFVEIQLDLLPLAPDDLVVEVEGDILRLRGSRLIEAEESAASSRHRLRKRWHFLRGLQLPPELNPASATARYEHGLLTVKIDKR